MEVVGDAASVRGVALAIPRNRGDFWCGDLFCPEGGRRGSRLKGRPEAVATRWAKAVA
jgi:hypothetical protein